MSIADYAHLWDGTEPGWTLRHYDWVEWKVIFRFAGNGPTLQEISKLRQLLDELRDEPVSKVWMRLRGRVSYALEYPLSNLEMRALAEKAERVGLAVSADPIDFSGYVPVHADGSSVKIKDNVIAAEVIRRMINSGVPVEEICVD